MIPITNITGRLGNQMFEFAALYSFCKKNGIDYYCQDESLFKEHESDIRSLFGTDIGFIPYVSIHVRRGKNPLNLDEPSYSENPFYVNIWDTGYYEKAISLFPGRKFLVFSDDPIFCKEQEIFKDASHFQVMEMIDEISDFNLQSSCSDHIIANSSWSWWTAYLSPHHGKKVVAPIKWYSDGNMKRTICPNEWIRI